MFRGIPSRTYPPPAAFAATIASRTMSRTTWSGTGPPRDVIAQQFAGRDVRDVEVRGDQRALSPLARARGRDHQYPHYSSPHVIIPPAGPRPVARPARPCPAPSPACPGSPPGTVRRTPSYERRKPTSLVFMPHARSADTCAATWQLEYGLGRQDQQVEDPHLGEPVTAPGEFLPDRAHRRPVMVQVALAMAAVVRKRVRACGGRGRGRPRWRRREGGPGGRSRA